MSHQTNLRQNSPDLLNMRTAALEPTHGWATVRRVQLTSHDVLRVPGAGRGRLAIEGSNGDRLRAAVDLELPRT